MREDSMIALWNLFSSLLLCDCVAHLCTFDRVYESPSKAFARDCHGCSALVGQTRSSPDGYKRPIKNWEMLGPAVTCWEFDRQRSVQFRKSCFWGKISLWGSGCMLFFHQTKHFLRKRAVSRRIVLKCLERHGRDAEKEKRRNHNWVHE